jgi:exonuclease SbcC
MANLMGGGRVDFILLDEPTANLDEERKKSLVKVISQLNPQSGASPLKQIIVITHDREIFDDANVNEVYRFEKTSNGSSVSRE